MSEEETPKPPDRPLPPREQPPRPPVPPPAGLLRREESPLMEYMRRRMELMERELIKERERAQASEGLLKQQETLRSEVEAQLKAISEQIRQEKAAKDLEGERVSRDRVASLEKRLDEMNKTWTELLKESLPARAAGDPKAAEDVRSLSEGLKALSDEVAGLKGDLSILPSLSGEVKDLSSALPAEVQRRARDDVAFRGHLRAMIDRFGENLIERLGALDRRLAVELEEHHERVSSLARERESLRETMEEQRHQIRQEHLKERMALESQFNEQVTLLKKSLEDISDRQSGDAEVLTGINELARKLHTILTQPQKAKDQMIQELEAEKRDLMHALKARTEQLRAYTLERRDVERSLGESLMDLTRQLEGERAKERQLKDHIASLENTTGAARSEMELMSREIEARDERFRKLAAERDEIVKALAEEAEKVKRQIEERLESDKRWEAKIIDMQRLMGDERHKRLQADSTIADLRSQMQTLSDHMTRVLQEKESIEKEFTQWSRQRDELAATLRKKDEMIGMLSSTFQNLLRKPN